MSRRRQIYEGKAKILYEGPEPGTLIQYFKDDATAFNAQKRGTISGKGVLNNRISEHIFTSLATIGAASSAASAAARLTRRSSRSWTRFVPSKAASAVVTRLPPN